MISIHLTQLKYVKSNLALIFFMFYNIHLLIVYQQLYIIIYIFVLLDKSQFFLRYSNDLKFRIIQEKIVY